jgi:hypothetical protein
MGNPLPLTNKDLDNMTTPEEIKKAQKAAAKLWRESVDPEIASLLDAVEIAE